MTYRQLVLAIIPQAEYMNVGVPDKPVHCIDDYYNDRYLAFAAKSRRLAWKEAAIFLGVIK